MLPLALDLGRLGVVVAGRGAGARRRLDLLDEAGAARVTVFSDAPDPTLGTRAGIRLRPGLPRPGDLAGCAVLFIADLPRPEAAALAAMARAAGVLVNVEDETALCDVHVPALVRRGDLVLSVSTGGRAPGLARALKRWLEALLDAEWATRLEVLTHRRQRWRAAGCSPREVSALTRRLLDARGWLATRNRDAA
ncbi:MAG: siroheme synthase [Proteobacteria bacterium]|nr:siroheme synthase [Pseudomonadota bacterium]